MLSLKNIFSAFENQTDIEYNVKLFSYNFYWKILPWKAEVLLGLSEQ